MKILHVLDHSVPLHSGYTFRTLAIVREQRARGWMTAHVTGAKQGNAKDPIEVAEGLPFFRTPQPAQWSARLPVLNQLAVIDSLALRLDEIVRQERPDVLHAHSPALNGVAVLRVARRYGLAVVYEVRAFWEDAAVDHGTSREGGLRYRLTRALETYVLRRADAVTTICEGLRADIVARGIPAEKVTVIPNAVDIDRFPLSSGKDEGLASRLNLANGRVIGFIGSFYAYEGLPLLLEAMPQILQAHPHTKILLVGGGPDEARIRGLIERLELQKDVVMVGRVPHEQVQSYYDLVDILVYPRYAMRLTELVTPLKPLEAMAQGRLVVASDVGGHRELIRDGVNGVLFSRGSAAALGGAVIGLLNNPSRWPSLRKAGRDIVEKERNWPVSVARYESVYSAAKARSQ